VRDVIKIPLSDILYIQELKDSSHSEI